MRVDYVIPGAAHHLPPGSGSVSLGQSEATKPGSLPPQDANHGQSHDVLKPIVKFIKSPNFNSRNGTKIDMIVMHFTDGPSAQGAINRFLDRNEQVSAHYIIDRGGTIYQMVEDGDKAWHAKAANPRSIGIEHVAVAGQQMAPAQTTASVALVRWLMASYGIKRSGIVGHRFAPGNEGTTDCPHHLFGNATKQAVVDWVNVHFPTEVS
jgi:N-acetyl-anhydromuramyl-L-alanine amidase AmpD